MEEVRPTHWKVTSTRFYQVNGLDLIDSEMVTSEIPEYPRESPMVGIYKGVNEVNIKLTSPLMTREVLPDEGPTKVSSHKVFGPIADRLKKQAKEKNIFVFRNNIVLYGKNKYLEIYKWDDHDDKECGFFNMLIGLHGYIIFERTVNVKNPNDHDIASASMKINDGVAELKFRVIQKPNLQIVK